MKDGFTRLTFVATEEIISRLNDAKKNRFYACTRSAMIRELIIAGLRASEQKPAKEKRCEQAG